MKGYMRIIEVLLVITLMFTLMVAVVSQNPPVQQAKNIAVLQRYAADAAKMLCGSERGAAIMLGLGATGWINESLAYALPENLKFSAIAVEGGVVQDDRTTGYALPSSGEIATSSCAVTGIVGGLVVTRDVVVRVWR